MKKHRTLLVALALLATSAPAAVAGGSASSGTLTLNAQVASAYRFVAHPLCPPGTPDTTGECVQFVSSNAAVPGLGRSTITYVKLLDDTICPNQVTQPRTITVDVAGRGRLDVAMAPACANYAPSSVVLNGTASGGTGVFAGASGNVQLATTVNGPQCGSGGCVGSATDTWTGSISVPGLDFDVTPPVLLGARSKTVKAPRKAKSVRVRYSVTAQDAGASLQATCKPRSGSRFKVGRTKVKCTAEDSSANVATASFTITVKRARR